MNAYEQLQTIREELEDREAGPETLRLVDRAITLAEREKDNPLSISQSMMLRHLLKMPEVANNHYVQMDLEALQGEIEDRRARRDGGTREAPARAMSTDPTPFTPPDWLDREDAVLAPYAMRTRASKGRRHPEEAHAYRTLYQRDRDRIVHSTAFRRLMYKTQVLVAATNDHHRTRLTHTLEVAQISRTIARQLGLNEDLTETIALHKIPLFGGSA